VCSADDGRTWRTVIDSDKVNYITGFHFQPSGTVYVSSYGQGLWIMKAAKGCPRTSRLPWDVNPPVVNPSTESTGPLAREAKVPPPPPRGLAEPNNPKLFLSASGPSGATTVLGPDGVLEITGSGFPAGLEVSVRLRDSDLVKQVLRIDPEGRLAAKLQLPAELPYGITTLEVVSAPKEEVLTTAEFTKAHLDEELARREPAPAAQQEHTR